MADDSGNYGTRHVMEEQMRAAEQGVFEAKAQGAAPSNKMMAPPSNKALAKMKVGDLIELADAEGVKVDAGDTKAELIAKIEKARG